MNILESSSKIDFLTSYPDHFLSNEEPGQGGLIFAAIEKQQNLIEHIIDSGKIPAVFTIGGFVWRMAEYIENSHFLMGDLSKQMAFIQMDVTKETLDLSDILLPIFSGEETLENAVRDVKIENIGKPEFKSAFQIYSRQDTIQNALARYSSFEPFTGITLLKWHCNLLEPANIYEQVENFRTIDLVPIVIDVSNVSENIYTMDKAGFHRLDQSIGLLYSLSDNPIVKNFSSGNDSGSWQYHQEII